MGGSNPTGYWEHPHCVGVLDQEFCSPRLDRVVCQFVRIRQRGWHVRWIRHSTLPVARIVVFYLCVVSVLCRFVSTGSLPSVRPPSNKRRLAVGNCFSAKEKESQFEIATTIVVVKVRLSYQRSRGEC